MVEGGRSPPWICNIGLATSTHLTTLAFCAGPVTIGLDVVGAAAVLEHTGGW